METDLSNKPPYHYTPKGTPAARVLSLWRHMRRLEREGHLPAPRQLWELIWLKMRRGVGPALYLRAGLYRRELPWREKLTYVGGAKYSRLVHSVNPIEHDHIARNKLETYRILSANGIPTPPIYGVVEGADAPNWDGGTLRSPDDLLELLQRLGVDTVCFKYITGTRGRGFYKVRIDGGGEAATATIQPRGEELSLREFWETLRREKLFRGYFCQGVIDQHADVARLNPWSVNTLRSWMARTAAGGWKMVEGVLRVAVEESAVDNISAGGIGIPIDLDTGRLSAATSTDVRRIVYATHPLTGAQIEGVVLPMWPDVLDLCRRTADLFPYYCLLSVDVAFGKDGPLVIELGTTPDGSQGESEKGAYPVLRQLKKYGRVEELP